MRTNIQCVIIKFAFYSAYNFDDIKRISTIYMQMSKNSFPIKVVKRVRKGYSIDISRHIYDAIFT